MSNTNESSQTSSTPSKASSTEDGSPVKEENFIESLKSQVDKGNIEDIIMSQKKTLERFEKTNEMLFTCCTLAEKRLEKTRREFTVNKEQILQAKSELDSIFRRILSLKRTLAKQYPEEYATQVALLRSKQDQM